MIVPAGARPCDPPSHLPPPRGRRRRARGAVAEGTGQGAVEAAAGARATLLDARLDTLRVRCVTLGPGGTVFEQGDAGLLFYVVLHGACELFVQEEKAASRAAGTPTLTSSLFLLYAGDSFGELSLIEEGADGAWRPGDRSGTVQATDGGVELLTLSQPEYMALVGTRY